MNGWGTGLSPGRQDAEIAPSNPRVEVERRKALQQFLQLNLSLEPDVVDAFPPELRRDHAASIRTARRLLPPEGGRIFSGGST